MWKKVLTIAGGAALVVALPVAALAMNGNGDGEGYGNDDKGHHNSAQEQTFEPQRLQIHSQTGTPDGVTPEQIREHQGDPTRMGSGTQMNHERGVNGGQGLGEGTQTGQHLGDGTGNPEAPMGDGSGECTHEGEPSGSGPYGPGGNKG